MRLVRQPNSDEEWNRLTKDNIHLILSDNLLDSAPMLTDLLKSELDKLENRHTLLESLPQAQHPLSLYIQQSLLLQLLLLYPRSQNMGSSPFCPQHTQQLVPSMRLAHQEGRILG
jgi:hypothetical protein